MLPGQPKTSGVTGRFPPPSPLSSAVRLQKQLLRGGRGQNSEHSPTLIPHWGPPALFSRPVLCSPGRASPCALEHDTMEPLRAVLSGAPRPQCRCPRRSLCAFAGAGPSAAGTVSKQNGRRYAPRPRGRSRTARFCSSVYSSILPYSGRSNPSSSEEGARSGTTGASPVGWGRGGRSRGSRRGPRSRSRPPLRGPPFPPPPRP